MKVDIPSYKYKGYSIYYYPGDRIEIRDGTLKIVIHKPGRCRDAYYSQMAYKEGILTFSSNARVRLNLHECLELSNIIKACVDKLNAEGGNQIIDSNTAFNADELVPFDSDIIPRQVKSVNKIKPSQLKPGNMYETSRGKKYLYLGKGTVYRQGKRPNGDLYEYLSEPHAVYHAVCVPDSAEYINIAEAVIGNKCIQVSIASVLHRESRKAPYKFTRDLGTKLTLVRQYIDKMGTTGLRLMIPDKLRGVIFIELN